MGKYLSPYMPLLKIECFRLILAIPWGHHKIILDRYESEPMNALFYAAKTLEHSWSRAVLENMMGDKGKDNGFYERQGKAVNNFPTTIPYPTGDLAAKIISDTLNMSFNFHKKF